MFQVHPSCLSLLTYIRLEELWHMILAQLCLRDIVRCRLVNTTWSANASSDALWRTVHDIYFAPPDSFPVVPLPPHTSDAQIE